MHPRELLIENFTYQLPVEKIALYPESERDHSKLLVWNNGSLLEDTYVNIARHLPAGSLVILNDTKVIPARLLFAKSTGGEIEIFCLEPYQQGYAAAMNKKVSSTWKCMIGGAGKWKNGILTKILFIAGTQILLSVKLINKLVDGYVTEFTWDPDYYSFAEIMQAAGEIPLPPYIKRVAETEDKTRYQTIYANYEGSVAAPTAGLHFTERILGSLEKRNIATDFVTLHVGAGTFKPVKSEKMSGHDMHPEWMEISVNTIEHILSKTSHITAVGTTSLRTLESLFWMGVKCIMNPSITGNELQITQWEVYEEPLKNCGLEKKMALMALLSWMERNKLQRLSVPTKILIAPGYTFRTINSLVTNFHQPQSTLLLLVAAIAGDNWISMYKYALSNEFRFLSYGDGCLLFV